MLRCGFMYGSPSYFFTVPATTSTTHSFRPTSVNRIFLEFGDQAGVYGKLMPGSAMLRGSA